MHEEVRELAYDLGQYKNHTVELQTYYQIKVESNEHDVRELVKV